MVVVRVLRWLYWTAIVGGSESWRLGTGHSCRDIGDNGRLGGCALEESRTQSQSIWLMTSRDQWSRDEWTRIMPVSKRGPRSWTPDAMKGSLSGGVPDSVRWE